MVDKHWSEVSRNPIDPAAIEHVRRLMETRYRGAVLDYPEFWKSAISGKSLLDIGVVEHALELTHRKGWRHAIFRDHASRCVGIDILEHEVAELKKLGFDIRLCDATSDEDLGERFDVVYIGDVIEHVNDPVKLVRFAGRHLSSNGKVHVTTPCPFWWQNIRHMIAGHTYVGNVDHLRWVTPANALEIGHRAGVPLTEYRTVETGGHTFVRKAVMNFINRLLGRSELFTWAYIFTFENITGE